ncbi:hypothetical protein Aperf_G00000101112 [Anoplocephala perfoliata]
MICAMTACGFYLSLVFLLQSTFAVKLNPIFAVNCGGDTHTDINGVRYDADFNNVGIASSHGLNLVLHGTPEQDAVLYQTERYDTSSFSYEFPMPRNGDYVLHLKFSEVWFQQPNEKVFSVDLNGRLRIINNLDIFNTVGFSVAHDENIPVTIKDGSIITEQGSVHFSDDENFRITFVKTPHDNPKINAIALFENSLEDIPRLPPIGFRHTSTGDRHSGEEGKKSSGSESSQTSRRSSLPSSLERPPAPDPYASTDYSTYILPLLAPLAALLPLVLWFYKA